jgi:hypothetical protein
MRYDADETPCLKPCPACGELIRVDRWDLIAEHIFGCTASLWFLVRSRID